MKRVNLLLHLEQLEHEGDEGSITFPVEVEHAVNRSRSRSPRKTSSDQEVQTKPPHEDVVEEPAVPTPVFAEGVGGRVDTATVLKESDVEDVKGFEDTPIIIKEESPSPTRSKSPIQTPTVLKESDVEDVKGFEYTPIIIKEEPPSPTRSIGYKEGLEEGVGWGKRANTPRLSLIVHLEQRRLLPSR